MRTVPVLRRLLVAVKITVDRIALFKAAMQALDDAEVLVGIPSDSEKNTRSDAPETNAEIGFTNEFGEPSMNIPERPFLLPGVNNAMPANEKIMLDAAKSIMTLSGDPVATVDNALNSVGLNSQQEVQKQIVEGSYQPLSKYTLAQRNARGFKGTKPLIETGSLKGSITFVVKK